MNERSGPLSSNSLDGSEWSSYSRQGPPSQPSYSPSAPHNRGNLVTPPISGSSNGPPPPMTRRPGEPSPPNSVGRSSYGTNFSSSDNQRRQAARMEERLSQHYSILKRFLAQSIRDEKTNAKPNRARDKLLRLSAIQFQELSTDVYDELLRRQSASGQQPGGPGAIPAYLLPKENFHPKRNQARQKLATLPPSRFRDLATDVFYELERRFPHFAGRDIPRNGSPAMHGPPSRVGTPNGMRTGGPGHPPRNASLGSQVMAGLGIPGTGPEDDFGRPTAKTFQSNTIIPNKSTMVEEDDDDGMSDVYGGRRDTTYTSRSTGGKAVAEYEAQITELQEKVKSMEDQVRDKDEELLHSREAQDRKQKADGADRERWEELKSDLESKLRDARSLNEHMKSELDRLQNEKERSERDMQAQLNSISSRAADDDGWRSRYESLDKSHQDLRADFHRQEQITNQVKVESTDLLDQLKGFSQQTDQSIQREEELVRRIHYLEDEVRGWKHRYANARTSARNTHAEPISSPTSDPRQIKRDASFSAPDGLVKDVLVTKFQIALDELVHGARSAQPDSVLSLVKAVVVSVRNITQTIGNPPFKGEEAEKFSRIRSKVSATTNNVITASRNFAVSGGRSPVSLLDAAASHLSTSVIETLRMVKIRPTPGFDLERDDDENSVIADSPADYYGISHTHSSVGGYSAHSSLQSPQEIQIGLQGKKTPLNGIPNGVGPPTNASQEMSHEAHDTKIEDLKNFLDTRTSNLLTGIQTLVSSIRTSAPPTDILDTIVSITSTTSQIIGQTHTCVPPSSSARLISQRLADSVEKMEQRGREGEGIDNEKDWNSYVKALPPLAFEIAREVKELGAWVEGELGNGDFS